MMHGCSEARVAGWVGVMGGGASTGTVVRAVNSSRPTRGSARVSTPQIKEGHRGAQGGACTDLFQVERKAPGWGASLPRPSPHEQPNKPILSVSLTKESPRCG